MEGKRGKDKMVVFIDELPWLDTPRANFLSAFEHFWNDWGSGRHNLLLVVCGSATSWMLDNLINNKGGLYGRTTREVHLHPFSLGETDAYLHRRGLTLNRYDVLQSYMRNPSNNRTFLSDNQNSPKLNSWRGRAFEDVCFVHQQQIRRALEIGGVQAEVYPWHEKENENTTGAQIDMLIDRSDRVVNLCEMKFSQEDLVISKDYDERLRRKLSVLMERTGGKRNVQVTLVTTFGLG